MRESQTHAIKDGTRNGVPTPAIAQAERVLRCPVVGVCDAHFDFTSKKLYWFSTSTSWAHREPYVLLMQQGDRFMEVNCREGLPVLREIMQDYRFTRGDFEDHRKLTDFCETILYLSGVPRGTYLACDALLKESEQDPNGAAFWTRNAVDESVFRNLCHDPGLAMDRNDWVAAFNIFLPDGSAEVWRVSGVWNPRTQTNTIEKIARFQLYSRGTFNCVSIGS